MVEVYVDFLDAVDGSLVDGHVADDVEPTAHAVAQHVERQDALVLKAAAQRCFGAVWVGDVLDAIQPKSCK